MMKKSIIVVLGIIIVAIAATWLLMANGSKTPPAANVPTATAPATVLDYKNLTYTIDDQKITLVNGFSQMPTAPGSVSKVTTTYFGNNASGDLNGDGKDDVAFILTQQTGGSGTFFYLAGALKTDTAWQPLNTIFLGDRISPQSTQISGGSVTVNYADRKPGEPMSTTPSVGVSKYFKIQNGELVLQMDGADFGKPVTLALNQQVKFSDGLVVMLKQINDSRCKPNVDCIWAGELSPVLQVNGQELILGTTTKKQVVKDDYTFELKDASTTTATIVVTKKAQAVAGCYVGGCSGELCSGQQGMVSSCIYWAEYACYKTATCAKQASGQCGWTKTPSLTTCLNGTIK